ncbi:hypothetical protein [Rhodoplanes roseus]|uniref:Uncharacterized protein n=1 Tax=Rhodoplanes roseus TaxID=29409 RepID=A0A327L220_9BRAD|nr:hypothetical protein [Rhodoplanes roseus]RAI44417.1 hypothetical protein CH341_09095 [Rhodoplanes roseus]
MREQQYLDDLSVRAAVAAWTTGEGAFASDIGSDVALTVSLLDRWLSYWDLADRLRRPQRAQFLAFLEQTARPAFRAATEPSPEVFGLLDDINYQAVRDGLTTSSLMIMLSRFACSCRPAVYAPASQHSRRGMQIIGRKLADMSYRTYMLAFMKERERFADRVATIVLADDPTGAAAAAVPLDVLVMRALDRRLMLAGGFAPERLEALVARAAKPAGKSDAPRAKASRPSASPTRAGRNLLPDQTAG